MIPQNRGPVSQEVWHDKDPSMLKGQLLKIFNPYQRNDEIFFNVTKATQNQPSQGPSRVPGCKR